MTRVGSDPARLGTLALTLVLVSALVLSTTGCDPSPSVVVERPGDAGEEDTATLTPIERGEVRRRMLSVAEEAIAAFLADDEEAIADIFDATYADTWTDYRASYAAEGEIRFREHLGLPPRSP